MCLVGVKRERMEKGGKEKGGDIAIFHCLVGVKRDKRKKIGWMEFSTWDPIFFFFFDR